MSTILAMLAIFCGMAADTASATTARIIIPKPQVFERIKDKGGRPANFRFTPETVILFEKDSKEAEKAAKFMAKWLKTPFGYKLETKEHKSGLIFGDRRPESSLLFTNKKTDLALGQEGYKLKVSKKQITITANRYAGFFYGFQTLRQLLPLQVESKTEITDISWTVPGCKITDKPTMSWRGMHLDVSRHFFNTDEIKQYIDYLAQHKMNIFHWHLIDDGGWRIEIKKYPKLTAQGAWRKRKEYNTKKLSFPLADGTATSTEGLYGGFYTQDEVREIVAYAKERNVNVLPEIEMPGHSLPALDAYPELRCKSTADVKKWPWGLPRQNSYCPGQEKTFAFLEDVLNEVTELFPFEYIHIGGDECDGFFWKECSHCNDRMKEETLENKDELQSWFIKRIENHLASKNRKLIGWDEIMEGGLSPDATVMFWIGMQNVPRAIKDGHDVVLSPTNPCYFDYSYANNSVEKIYKHKFLPEGLTPEQEVQILGSQGSVWTERMHDFSRVQYMIMPRMLALAENLWTAATRKDSNNFLTRLGHYYQRLDYMGVNYFMPSPRAKNSAVIFAKGEEAKVEFIKPGNPNFSIRYTVDGSEPTATSAKYSKPIKVTATSTVKAVTVSGNERVSNVTAVKCVQFEPEVALETESGLYAVYAEGKWQRVPNFKTVPVKHINKVASFDLSRRNRNNDFAFLFDGFITIEKEGLYSFVTGSDDGSWLDIGGARIVDNDGLHGYSEKAGNVYLKPGLYPLQAGFVEATGSESFNVFIEPPGEKLKKLPASMLSRPKTYQPLLGASIATSMSQYQNNVPENAYDGSGESVFWSDKEPVADDHFTLTFTELATISSIKVVTGKKDGKAKLASGVVEVAADAHNFEQVAEFDKGIAIARFNPRKVKTIRIRITANSSEWLVINDITVK